jgi:hypothetical protein
MSADEPTRPEEAQPGREVGARRMASAGSDAPPEEREPEELRREIEDTRAEVGETVEALAQKTDVKSQIKNNIGERTSALRDRRDSARRSATQTRDRVVRATPMRPSAQSPSSRTARRSVRFRLSALPWRLDS